MFGKTEISRKFRPFCTICRNPWMVTFQVPLVDGSESDSRRVLFPINYINTSNYNVQCSELFTMSLLVTFIRRFLVISPHAFT